MLRSLGREVTVSLRSSTTTTNTSPHPPKLHKKEKMPDFEKMLQDAMRAKEAREARREGDELPPSPAFIQELAKEAVAAGYGSSGAAVTANEQIQATQPSSLPVFAPLPSVPGRITLRPMSDEDYDEHLRVQREEAERDDIARQMSRLRVSFVSFGMNFTQCP